jgi:hypothetical protein
MNMRQKICEIKFFAVVAVLSVVSVIRTSHVNAYPVVTMVEGRSERCFRFNIPHNDEYVVSSKLLLQKNPAVMCMYCDDVSLCCAHSVCLFEITTSTNERLVPTLLF